LLSVIFWMLQLTKVTKTKLFWASVTSIKSCQSAHTCSLTKLCTDKSSILKSLICSTDCSKFKARQSHNPNSLS
jgi:hypothetical protein